MGGGGGRGGPGTGNVRVFFHFQLPQVRHTLQTFHKQVLNMKEAANYRKKQRMINRPHGLQVAC